MKVCELCGREAHLTRHHLIPRTKIKQNKYKLLMMKGHNTAMLCDCCHRQIHALFSEKELAEHYNSIEALLSNSDVQRFIKWIRTKPVNMRLKVKRSKK